MNFKKFVPMLGLGVSAFLVVFLALTAWKIAEANALPDSQTEIEAAIKNAQQNNRRLVQVAGKPIGVASLRVPQDIVLRGTDVNRDGKSDTRFVLPRNTHKPVVIMTGNNNSIQNIILDGNRDSQPKLAGKKYYDGSTQPNSAPAVLRMLCSACTANKVRTYDAVQDGVETRGQNITVKNSESWRTGRFGFTVSSSNKDNPSSGITFVTSKAWNTGRWYVENKIGPGPGAGFHASIGNDITWDGVHTWDTNGDGVAAYTSFNKNNKVINSKFERARNHCVHIGGDNAILKNNRCHGARWVGMYIANNHRPGWESQRNSTGGRVINNIIDKTRTGVKVNWVVKDTVVNGNRVNGGLYNFEITNTSGYAVPMGRNVGRNYKPAGCHVRVFSAKVIFSKANPNSFPGKKTC